MPLRFALVLLCLLAALVPAPSPAQSPAAGAICGERAALVARLRDNYGETRRGYGLQRGTSVVEVFASEETGSWTILLTSPDGVACLMAAGEHWAPVAEPAGSNDTRL